MFPADIIVREEELCVVLLGEKRTGGGWREKDGKSRRGGRRAEEITN